MKPVEIESIKKFLGILLAPGRYSNEIVDLQRVPELLASINKELADIAALVARSDLIEILHNKSGDIQVIKYEDVSPPLGDFEPVKTAWTDIFTVANVCSQLGIWFPE